MLITIGKTEIETAEVIKEVMDDVQLESRILEIVNAELGYQNDRGVKALVEKAKVVAAEKYATFDSARETDTKAEILAKISVVEVAKVEVLP